MRFFPILSKNSLKVLTLLLITAWLFSGWPPVWKSPQFPPEVGRASAANFTMQTGYYYGNGLDNRAISGLGFQPSLVLIRSTVAGTNGMLWKSSAMSGETTALLSVANADIALNAIQSLDVDGFTIGTDTDVNTSGVFYSYIAFSGSDCTATGTFCVGSYTGNGTAQSPTTGFQPDLVVVKRSGATAGVWKNSSMGVNNSDFFGTTAESTAGTIITTLGASSFTVGNNAAVNTSASTYWFFAFKQSAGVMDVGTYTGNAIDNRNIDSTVDAGLTFKPDFVFTKSTANVAAVYSSNESYGDGSYYFTATARAADNIQSLLPGGGFQIGTLSTVNRSGTTFYYAAFGGAVSPTGTGTFQMAEGNYTGNGTSQSVAVSFSPDLVIIKQRSQATNQYAVFRTSIMPGDSTAYFANAVANFTTGITALTSTGFTVGASATVNTSADTYHWVAYGNAWTPDNRSGAADFVVGVYPATVSTTSITRIPFQPDLVTIKQSGTTAGVFRTSSMTGDLTDNFAATASLAGAISAINTDGFQIAVNPVVGGTINNQYWYYAFKSGINFAVGTYTGTGATSSVSTVGFNPDYVWTKKRTGGTARGGVMKAKTDSGLESRPFINAVFLLNGLTGFLSINNGFQVGPNVGVNESTFTYDYVTSKIPVTYEQSSYRFFNNVDSTSVGTALAATDTAATLANTGDPFRLRMNIYIGGNTGGLLDNSEDSFALQYAAKSGTCDTGFVGETYATVTAATVIAFKDNPTPVDGAALTSSVNDPPGLTSAHAAAVVRNQTYEELNNATNTVSSIAVGEQGKWDFSLLDNGAAQNSTYCLRAVRSDGSLLNTYTVIPEVTTKSLPVLTQNYFRFYDDNDALKPTDPWPAGIVDLGENTAITSADNPLANTEKLRLRMSIQDSNVGLAASAQAFRLQFGTLVSTCGAIASWTDLGAPAGAAIWRGVNDTPVNATNLSGDPPTAGDLLLTVSDRAGTYQEQNDSAVNPFAVAIGEDLEYDWVVQNNGAANSTNYCFRMVSGGTGTALNGYNFYPVIKTAGYRPKSQNWRWYDDETNETPVTALAAENTAPINIAQQNLIKLRMTLKETANIAGSNVKYKLQFSENSDFSAPVYDVAATTTCTDASMWCYADGAGVDNAVITTKVLSDADPCVASVGNGCGTHNETPSFASTFTHPALAATEFEFTLKNSRAVMNRTYFFRAYDTVNNVPVLLNTGKNYPSLSTEGSTLTFSVGGLATSTVTEGVTTDIGTTPTSIPYGPLTIGSQITAAQRLTTTTNATEGYEIFINTSTGFVSSSSQIPDVTTTNASPGTWAAGCLSTATGCFGYHAGDDTLSAGSTRFLPNNTFAAFETTLREIAYSSVPVTNDVVDMVFSTQVTNLQPAGMYQTTVEYVVVPAF